MFTASIYQPLYLAIVTVLTLLVSSGFRHKTANQMLNSTSRPGWIAATVLVFSFAWFLGGRPQTYAFGDTGNYAFVFENLKQGVTFASYQKGEWLWDAFMQFCADVTDTRGFLTAVDLFYLGFTALSCFLLIPKYGLSALLFNLAALSFFTYGTNGIRNGLGCSLMLVAIAFATLKGKEKYIALITAYLAYNIHHSTLLPFGMMIISMFVIKSYKWAYVFWIISIFVSLVAGGFISSLFASLGFDDRLSYLTTEANSEEFSHTGFRFDFLIYSMMPILLGYYIIIKRGIRNKTYELLLNTYTLTNAFWVMVIRANFSNRFAYLSWFLYPVVLAYPLFKMNVWGSMQGKRASQIMLAQLAFTLFMDIFYW